MLRFLQKLTPEQEQARISALAAEPLPPRAPPPRPVGRPALKRAPTLTPPADEPSSKRQYTQWFTSSLMPQILKTYHQEGGSPRATVRALQRRGELFSGLSESTLRSWFNPDHRLKPKFVQLMDEPSYARAGQTRAFADHPELEDEIKAVLLQMRDSTTAGISVGVDTIRFVMQAILRPGPLEHLQLSKAFISRWATTEMQWTFRRSTTAASKLPEDWHAQGIRMAQSIAATMGSYDVHPSLVINCDQAGLHLVPASARSYEAKGARSVPVAGADDKRQITVVVSSALDGTLLPLQLIFQGKTAACLPAHTAETKQSGFHLTMSENHWSNQATMRQLLEHIIEPHRAAQIASHGLKKDAHVILVLDVWAVHISKEFRAAVPPHVHLVYIPPSCTSKLQVADVALNYPFKHGFRCRFNAWAADVIHEQIKSGQIVGLKPLVLMSVIKPKVLEWALESWKTLAAEKQLIIKGWARCVTELFDVNDAAQRSKAMAAAMRREIDAEAVPEGIPKEDEVDDDGFCAEESDSEDEEKTVRQIMKERVFGERRSSRTSAPPQRTGFMLNTAQLKFS